MAYIAKKAFIDGEGGQWYRKGDVYKGDRPDVLTEKGYLLAEDVVVNEKGKEVDIERLTKRELQALFEDNHLEYNQDLTKAALIEQYQEWLKE